MIWNCTVQVLSTSPKEREAARKGEEIKAFHGARPVLSLLGKTIAFLGVALGGGAEGGEMEIFFKGWFVCFRETERESARENKQGERQRERTSSRLPAELRAWHGAWFQGHELKPRAKHLTDWTTQEPLDGNLEILLLPGSPSRCPSVPIPSHCSILSSQLSYIACKLSWYLGVPDGLRILQVCDKVWIQVDVTSTCGFCFVFSWRAPRLTTFPTPSRNHTCIHTHLPSRHFCRESVYITHILSLLTSAHLFMPQNSL